MAFLEFSCSRCPRRLQIDGCPLIVLNPANVQTLFFDNSGWEILKAEDRSVYYFCRRCISYFNRRPEVRLEEIFHYGLCRKGSIYVSGICGKCKHNFNTVYDLEMQNGVDMLYFDFYWTSGEDCQIFENGALHQVLFCETCEITDEDRLDTSPLHIPEITVYDDENDELYPQFFDSNDGWIDELGGEDSDEEVITPKPVKYGAKRHRSGDGEDSDSDEKDGLKRFVFHSLTDKSSAERENNDSTA